MHVDKLPMARSLTISLCVFVCFQSAGFADQPLNPKKTLSTESRPNVLFLAVDDMNDWIGCLGAETRAVTPNFDRLAARGVNFSNAHTAGVFCAPSRAAIFT